MNLGNLGNFNVKDLLFGKSDKIKIRHTSPDALLPIGSVVRLFNGQKKLMVVGRFQQSPKLKEEFDYYGVIYPEGWLDPDHTYLFNNEDIQEIFFKGFDNEEELAIKNQLKDYMTKNNLFK